ncbi:MAG: hypothetical protein KIT79_06620 [Deltaproteobacteria bacterium]|nr:hypothetical protein [Deltaproteobacteria bacterium]
MNLNPIKQAGAALAAITTLGLAACSDSNAPDATFLPGDYVAGAIYEVPGLPLSISPAYLGSDSDRYGLLELTVEEDGTITGTLMDYIAYYNPGGLPDDNEYIDDVYDVEGTVEGTSFTATVDVGMDYPEVTIEGTITPDGILTGEIIGTDDEGSETLGYTGGVVVDGEELGLACGYFSVNDEDENYLAQGDIVVLARDSDLIGIFYDWEDGDFGVFTGTMDMDDGEGEGTLTGRFDGEDVSASAVINNGGLDGNYFEVNAGFTSGDAGYFYGDSEDCYDWD